ncbi:MAG: DUF6249 domain-containing protein [Bacteroides sp.]|uniref:DUF6249 domain-containing protein n=1 Tax=Bacteroides sp. TaxID=29523 RepID=UPI002FC5EB4A
MMDFISVPVIVGIVFLGVYKLFELFVCKSERLKVIDKLNDRLYSADITGKLSLPNYQQPRFSFGALKAGCLMVGIGLGLLIGFFICLNAFPDYQTSISDWRGREVSSIIYGSCVLLFGGLGLLIAFLIELKTSKKREVE